MPDIPPVETRDHASASSKHLLYIADPMCSWCYGFAPVITEIAQRLAGLAPVRVVMGGLRPGVRWSPRIGQTCMLGSILNGTSTNGKDFTQAL